MLSRMFEFDPIFLTFRDPMDNLIMEQQFLRSSLRLYAQGSNSADTAAAAFAAANIFDADGNNAVTAAAVAANQLISSVLIEKTRNQWINHMYSIGHHPAIVHNSNPHSPHSHIHPHLNNPHSNHQQRISFPMNFQPHLWVPQLQQLQQSQSQPQPWSTSPLSNTTSPTTSTSSRHRYSPYTTTSPKSMKQSSSPKLL